MAYLIVAVYSLNKFAADFVDFFFGIFFYEWMENGARLYIANVMAKLAELAVKSKKVDKSKNEINFYLTILKDEKSDQLFHEGKNRMFNVFNVVNFCDWPLHAACRFSVNCRCPFMQTYGEMIEIPTIFFFCSFVELTIKVDSREWFESGDPKQQR